MAYKYQGDVVITSALTVGSPTPLDTRTVVEDINALYDIPEHNAYQGMTVANINDGNLYMLIDKNKIKEKAGWKASYESIQIITCTQDEYDTWAANTTEDYKPIDGNLTYLRRDIYYYIYENEEKSQYYVTKKQIEDWLDAKASATEVESLRTWVTNKFKDYEGDSSSIGTSIQGILDTLDSDYITSEQIASIYATQESLKTTNDKFDSYYTKEEVSNTFVTKEALGGDLDSLGGDSFVFVTSEKYNTDRGADASKFTTLELVLGETSITTDAVDLLVNNKPLAYKESVPKIELVETMKQYEEMNKDPETYYYVCDDETLGYITNVAATEQFFTKTQVYNLIAQAKQELIDNYIVPLQERLALLESV